MKTSIKYLVRTLVLATAMLGFGASGLSAKQLPFRGWFHDTCLSEPILNYAAIHVDLGGAGWVSLMSFPATCLGNDQTNNMTPVTYQTPLVLSIPDPQDPTKNYNLLPLHGIGIYTLRESSGDSIILRAEMTMDGPPKNGHLATFKGTFEIVGGTGRFAGASGNGNWAGWADSDNPADISCPSGPGYWDFSGTIILPDKPHQHTK